MALLELEDVLAAYGNVVALRALTGPQNSCLRRATTTD
jgi:hypothetical protein